MGLVLRDGREIEPPEVDAQRWPAGQPCPICRLVVWDGHIDVHGHVVPCEPKPKKRSRKR